jgi:myo-inositol 2-dehydrogenase / D-chiro-inositol 1-dehydrogenase
VNSDSTITPTTSRRDFLLTSGAALAASSLAAGGIFATGSDTLKVGLIGCGGRGTGAAKNALKADPAARLTAVADAFDDRLKEHLAILQKDKEIAGQVAVTPETCFVGFDAYKKVLNAGVDVVLLCTPPGFRPLHLKAAIEAGKHVFCEKPVAVDAPGVRSVIETSKLAKSKNVSLMSGFCYRHDHAKIETIDRIHSGAIGEVVAIQSNYLTNPIWHRKSESPYGDMEYQMRNWYYFTWLSGDFIVEQHIHSLDKAAWVLGGAYPIAAVGLGGRQQRVEPKFGNIWDHFSVMFEYEGGQRVYSNCRQMSGCVGDVSDHVMGTKGSAELMSHTIRAEKPWSYSGEAPNMYDQEHIDLFRAIRSGKPFNDGEAAAHSTLMGIMGRMSAYTGKKITWQQALSSKEDLTPKAYEWGANPVASVAVPGVTKFV